MKWVESFWACHAFPICFFVVLLFEASIYKEFSRVLHVLCCVFTGEGLIFKICLH